MSQKTLHKADSRGEAKHGWLRSHHSFSFASYHNPERMGFGKLRVINDDVIQASTGFGTHPHNNMEIISIPLSGSLEHKDSEGNEHIIRAGEIQVMSAGSGIKHSEYNHSSTEEANFLQIWVMPEKLNIAPRYDQKKLDLSKAKNQFQTIVSPLDSKHVETAQINQQSYFALAEGEANSEFAYEVRMKGNGVYFFVIEGRLEILGEQLSKKDALGVESESLIAVKCLEASRLLAIEVPMK